MCDFHGFQVKTIRSLSASRLGSKFQAAPEPDVEKEVQLVIKSDVPVKATKTVKKEAANDSALYYKVAFDYHADNGDELTLAVGDVIKVNRK